MDEKIFCLVVDDEPIARKIIERYCTHFPQLALTAACGSALEAKYILQSQPIDILFLDINMPVLDGIAFLKTLRQPPQVIFTTAYKEFALDAFDLSACDYLLKPFSLERFIIAIDKAIEKVGLLRRAEKSPTAADTEKSTNCCFIKAEGKIHKLQFGNILYAEASGNYTKIISDNLRLLPTMTFSAFEEMVPAQQFARIHRSFIVNKTRITHIEGNRVYLDKIELPIGNNYKDDFLRHLGI